MFSYQTIVCFSETKICIEQIHLFIINKYVFSLRKMCVFRKTEHVFSLQLNVCFGGEQTCVLLENKSVFSAVWLQVPRPSCRIAQVQRCLVFITENEAPKNSFTALEIFVEIYSLLLQA